MASDFEVNDYVYGKLIEKGVLSWEKREQKGNNAINHELIDLYESEYFGKNRDDNILEIGCGCGDFYIFLKKEGFHNIFAIDISENAISVAKKKAEKENIDPKGFYLLDITSKDDVEMHFNEMKFSKIIDSFCWHCIIDKDKRYAFLQNIYNLLEKKGILFLSTMMAPVNISKENAWDKMHITEDRLHWVKVSDKSLAIDSNVKEIDGDIYVPFRYFATKEEIFDLVKNVGFEILEYKITEPIKEKEAHSIFMILHKI